MEAAFQEGQEFIDLLDHPSSFGIVLDLLGDNIRTMATMAMVHSPMDLSRGIGTWMVRGLISIAGSGRRAVVGTQHCVRASRCESTWAWQLYGFAGEPSFG